MTLRETAEIIFRQSIADCGIEQAFARAVKIKNAAPGQQLLIRGVEPINFDHVRRIRIVAMGKASSEMLHALLTRLSAAWRGDIAGVLIARERPLDLPPGFQFFRGSHPLPDEESFAGAGAALEMLRGLQQDCATADATLCLFLISGGASAMMELPLEPSITLADTIGFYRELVHSGASITEINCIRKHFSAVKGGRLAIAAGDVPSISLLVSDVPPGHLDALASGPTLPDSSTVEQCREILARYRLRERFPAAVQRFFDREDLPETPKRGSFAARTATLLSSNELAELARAQAERHGFHAVIDNTCDDWGYREAAQYLIDRLRGLRRDHPRVCLISAGEVTVELPSANSGIAAGAGGRNQHFSLYAATLLGRSDASTVVLSAGSDGIDGNSPAAGAVIDDRTLGHEDEPEIRTAARHALKCFDSYTFLESMGCAITTGPTGNNLRDLRILLAEQDSEN